MTYHTPFKFFATTIQTHNLFGPTVEAIPISPPTTTKTISTPEISVHLSPYPHPKSHPYTTITKHNPLPHLPLLPPAPIPFSPPQPSPPTQPNPSSPHHHYYPNASISSRAHKPIPITSPCSLTLLTRSVGGDSARYGRLIDNPPHNDLCEQRERGRLQSRFVCVVSLN